MSAWERLLDDAGFVPTADASVGDQSWDDFALDDAVVLDRLFSASRVEHNNQHEIDNDHDNQTDNERDDMARKKPSRNDDDDIADGARRQSPRDRPSAEADQPDSVLRDVIISSARQTSNYNLGDTGTHEMRSAGDDSDRQRAVEDSVDTSPLHNGIEIHDSASTSPLVPDMDSDQSGMAVDDS